MARYFADVAGIRAVGISTKQWVEVVRDQDGDIDVRIRPGLLRRCTEQEVADEIRSALVAALVEHRRQYRQLRVDYFGSPVGVRESTPPELPDGEERTR
ncbi:hypothetical protein [Verrucosispora sp. FIM060022]|uniref:hypothetical protein n=1 Tax=Verrucosispora sp. FIM060022 TaxID=1479020 RepID=UPI00256EE66E|nr:hypothetical protein [Verrucosispora sp. FIM060022]